MRAADSTPYAILGLQPGADRAAIDAAYKKLIKRYHPDRKGGNAARAAEINRAYSELRAPREQALEKDPAVDLSAAIYARRAKHFRPVKRRPQIWPPLVVLALIGLVVAEWDPIAEAALQLDEAFQQALAPPESFAGTGHLQAASEIDEPLHQDSIESAVREAARLLAQRDMPQAEERSRACHRALREAPDAARLDGCASFDMAVVTIARRDALNDDGPFSASAVTARHMTAARLLTDDYYAIEERLDRVRDRVEFLLSPAPPLRPLDAPPGTAGSLPPLVSSADGPAAH